MKTHAEVAKSCGILTRFFAVVMAVGLAGGALMACAPDTQEPAFPPPEEPVEQEMPGVMPPVEQEDLPEEPEETPMGY